MPAPTDRCVGGHAVLVVGYDLNAKTFKVRNSWGNSWGQAGYFTLPFDYLLGGLGADFWTLVAVSP
jgi:C1A family cysteine protease